MIDILTLKPGALTKGPSKGVFDYRLGRLHKAVHKYYPELIAAVLQCKKDKALLMLHQDAFAAAHDPDEYVLLGMLIKFAGYHGVGVHITGTNGETFKFDWEK